jgi:hypothetical protein
MYILIQDMDSSPFPAFSISVTSNRINFSSNKSCWKSKMMIQQDPLSDSPWFWYCNIFFLPVKPHSLQNLWFHFPAKHSNQM